MRNIAIIGPDWLTRSAIYQINPRTFCEEGTISAVTKELPKLAEMGFRIMYLCPIFEEDASTDPAYWSNRQKKSQTNNPKNPYRMKNYFTIDEEYGTMEDLKAFISESHRLGMRVLLDLVYAHIGPNADILKTHPEFAQQDAQGTTILSPWFFPFLDFTCPGLREYLWSNMTYYVGVLDVDGFRCDVGDMVPIDFWAEGRRRMQAIKPDSVLINEGSKPNYVREAFDATYCFPWHEAVYSTYVQGEPTQKMVDIWQKRYEELPAGALQLRDVENHDTVTDWPIRPEAAIGHQGVEQMLVLNYLLDGIPMVYCGNELADASLLSMFANRFHRGRFEATDRSIAKEEFSQRRQSIIRKLNALKRECNVLRYGETAWLHADKTVGFTRTWQGQRITFIGNPTNETCTVSASVKGETLFESGCALQKDTIELAPYGYIAWAEMEE